MRICVLQSSYEGSGYVLNEHDQHSDPSEFTELHTFEHRCILKDTAKEQIDAIIGEKFDFYFNFMWGQHEDKVAGIDACKYFESFEQPFAGLRSRILERSKNDFYRDARASGSPRVPGQENFPLFVTSCGSHRISKKSICYNELDLIQTLESLNQELVSGRPMEFYTVPGISPSIRIPENVVVQELIAGTDYSVLIVEIGDCPAPLNPVKYVYPTSIPSVNGVVTYDVAFHPEAQLELMEPEAERDLFDKLQKSAVEAFRVNKMQGCSWGRVDVRVSPSGEPVVIEVNPMPAVFLPQPREREDISIRRSFPGGHRAFINTLIAGYQTRQPSTIKTIEQVSGTYDSVSSLYDEAVVKNSGLEELINKVISKYNFDGSILDIGCGTGLFGRCLSSTDARPTPPPEEAKSHTSSTPDTSTSQPKNFALTGVEISPGMIEVCKKLGVYHETVCGSAQSVVPSLGSFDHIVSFNVLLFLSGLELSMVLAAAFRQARKSIAFSIDEIPDDFNDQLSEKGQSHMMSQNHLKEVEAFGVPVGWKLVHRFRSYLWKSPGGEDVFATVFMFEREAAVAS
ncbi:hypothetical protein FQN54_005997 [Arachnomyces sp. PD_36]|nr:hypothetical protein FQN54_005997 [Arachnomyces sp. PD_36]